MAITHTKTKKNMRNITHFVRRITTQPSIILIVEL